MCLSRKFKPVSKEAQNINGTEAKGVVERQDPTVGAVAERFARGFFYPFSTIGYMLRNPLLWAYAALPVIMTACALIVIIAVLFTWGDSITELLWSRPEDWHWLLLWYPLHVLILLLIFALFAVTLPSLVSSPFSKALSRRSEQIEIGQKISKGRIKDFFRALPSALLNELRKLGFLLLVHLLILTFLLLPMVGQLLYPLIAWTWTVLWLAVQNLDFSFSRHGHGFMETPRLVRKNLVLSFGFGIAVFLFLLIPFLNFIFVPVAVVAGTRLYIDLKRFGVVTAPDAKG